MHPTPQKTVHLPLQYKSSHPHKFFVSFKKSIPTHTWCESDIDHQHPRPGFKERVLNSHIVGKEIISDNGNVNLSLPLFIPDRHLCVKSVYQATLCLSQEVVSLCNKMYANEFPMSLCSKLQQGEKKSLFLYQQRRYLKSRIETENYELYCADEFKWVLNMCSQSVALYSKQTCALHLFIRQHCLGIQAL